MKNILKYFPILIIAWSAFDFYQFYFEKQELLNLKIGQIPALDMQIDKNKKMLGQLEQYKTDIEDAKRRMDIAQKELDKIQNQLPNEISNAEYLQFLSEIAGSLNIKNISLNPGDEEEREFIVARTFNVKAQGTFLQFLIMMEKIAENERLLNIDKLKIIRSSQQQRGRFQLVELEMSVEAYRFNQKSMPSSKM